MLFDYLDLLHNGRLDSGGYQNLEWLPPLLHDWAKALATQAAEDGLLAWYSIGYSPRASDWYNALIELVTPSGERHAAMYEHAYEWRPPTGRRSSTPGARHSSVC